MARARLQGFWSWASVSLLVLLCGVVAVLQYRWIGEISGAERQRLREQLQTRLAAVRRDFSNDISEDCAAMVPDATLVERSGRDAAYAMQYAKWKQAHAAMFRRIALAVPQGGALAFYDLDLRSGRLSHADWPAEWNSIREGLAARLTGAAVPPAQVHTVLEMPRFDATPGNGPQEREWLLFDLDLAYVRQTMIPELLGRHLGASGKVDFDAEIVAGQAPAELIYQAAPAANGRIGETADASVTLLDGMGGPGGPGGPPPDGGFRGAPPSPDFRSGGPGRGLRGEPARLMPRPVLCGPGWSLLVRHKAGSLEALVEKARVRNLAISGGLLLLIVATVATLVRFSRQAQRLAELQMSFVAGVSHELRTPLTVIRTAAFNLRGKLAQKPGQVERYGELIQEESEKLTELVEQVLEFAKAEAGAAIRQREPVAVAELIAQSLQSSRALAEKADVVLEKQIEPGLPCILADEIALRHALQNLIDNALKYGTGGSNWIGISATAVGDGAGQAVEITVADRGRGIPRDEQKHIFDPFFRGRSAVADQIHGTGLGLDIVRKIVEAHGGSIRFRSTPGKITEFTVRIPAAPAPDAGLSAKGA
jgi:signal transduction histidine kinase